LPIYFRGFCSALNGSNLHAKGLSHSDAEGAFFASSAYKCTPEAENATKKPHKMKKPAERSADFNFIEK